MRTRKISLTAIVAGMLCGIGLARAAVVTLSFDEAGIDKGATITTQYAPQATFTGAAAIVKLASEFNNPFEAFIGQLVHFQTSGTSSTAAVTLDTAVEYLNFRFRRPSESGDIALRLYNGADLVLDAGIIGWDPTVTPSWVLFEYSGTSGLYDRVEFFAVNKFVVDSFTFGAQPEPPADPEPNPTAALSAIFGLLIDEP